MESASQHNSRPDAGPARTGLPRRRVLGAGAAGLAAAGLAGVAGPATAAPQRAPEGTAVPGPAAADDRPAIEFAAAVDRSLGAAYRAALHNLLDINTVPYDPAVYDRTGLLSDPPGTFLRAGGGYDQPWTRDAATNSANAGSLLCPAVARNTLWAVCDRDTDGGLIVQQDNQWWDQIGWAVAAWHHHLVTGDDRFLADAYQAARNTLRANRSAHHNADYGLFEGPAFMQDGIAGYPAPPYADGNGSSFVLDYPGAETMMCLSTNCVYHAAFLALAQMAEALGDRGAAGGFRGAAARLRAAINRHLWHAGTVSYGYFVHGSGAKAGVLEPYQEAAGLAFAVLAGVASGAQVRRLFATAHREPRGVVNVWPHFARFDDTHPGRHNVIVWPMVVGMYGHAAAVGGRGDLFARAVTDIAALAGGDGHFWELYNARSGAPDGGWQVGHQWDSEPDQTWSATGYLRLIHRGLFGLRFTRRGLRLAPTLPAGWGPVRLRGLRYRNATIDLTLTGAGSRVVAAT
ncbi:MGH1-like glycoside hydrolase domain-containing protein, partial [Actinocatenispora thailandica]